MVVIKVTWWCGQCKKDWSHHVRSQKMAPLRKKSFGCRSWVRNIILFSWFFFPWVIFSENWHHSAWYRDKNQDFLLFWKKIVNNIERKAKSKGIDHGTAWPLQLCTHRTNLEKAIGKEHWIWKNKRTEVPLDNICTLPLCRTPKAKTITLVTSLVNGDD